MTSAQASYVSWMADVLVYIVVVEFHHAIVIDSFWISILTAILLKLLLDDRGSRRHAEDLRKAW